MDTYEIVMYFDPLHSEKYIVKLLTKCIPHLSKSRATNVYLVAQTNGRSVVFSGYAEHAEHFFEMMCNFPLEQVKGRTVPPVMFEMSDTSGKRVD